MQLLPQSRFHPVSTDRKLQEPGQLSAADPKTVFYTDVANPLDENAISDLGYQSKASFLAACGKPAWSHAYYDGRRSYFHTLQHKAIVPIAQEMMLKTSGVAWNIEVFESSYSPFLSHPEKLCAWLVE